MCVVLRLAPCGRGCSGSAIGLALADSSVVTLALPDVLGDFDVGITTVAWVLTRTTSSSPSSPSPPRTSRGADPGQRSAARRRFAGASLACGLAPSFEVLVGARCVQALGGALIVTSALDLLSGETGDDARAARIRVAAGVLGAALGPAAGGILTHVLGWESIFLVQVLLALVTLVAVRGVRPTSLPASAGRPHLTANAALLLLSGGLVAALFLLVLLLVEGWGMEPAAAGVVVTAMPLAAIAGGAVRATLRRSRDAHGGGVVLVAGGLGALAVLPRAGWAWTIPRSSLSGRGSASRSRRSRSVRLRGRAEQVVHGGWTLAARHAGVVLGLLCPRPS